MVETSSMAGSQVHGEQEIHFNLRIVDVIGGTSIVAWLIKGI